ncbi:translation elongation factor Ts [Synoicihabitans lomoniglobus]|uniref:Elongation factor Ts n=1 Tax=Synoicihabitans lomoniglobus TaxID=2909285 RepID=A0AAF0CM55_9BACT|nr:translation elongation factor Ts [Opitutaceae bacterium LMO-M01]WED63648.1 translation elongation factor Ts [Opitutaceae bacterium LMO-M01]
MSTTITASMVNDLRKATGAGLMKCKQALVEANGNVEEASTILRKQGEASAAKKAERDAKEGVIESYIHLGGKVGVLIEVNCETDFVARNDDFKAFVKDICLHIAAAAPTAVNREEVDQELVEKEREIAAAQAEGKPPMAVQKIVEGKLEKFYAQSVLLDQPFVKNPDQTIREYISATIQKTGENIQIRRFTRYQLGA